MEQTAVEWLVQQLSKEWQLEDRDKHLIEQAKQMEQQQVVDALKYAFNREYFTSNFQEQKELFDQYHNETFKK